MSMNTGFKPHSLVIFSDLVPGKENKICAVDDHPPDGLVYRTHRNSITFHFKTGKNTHYRGFETILTLQYMFAISLTGTVSVGHTLILNGHAVAVIAENPHAISLR